VFCGYVVLLSDATEKIGGPADRRARDLRGNISFPGDAETCAGRLRELVGLGLERIVMVPGSRDADPALVAEPNERFASEVLPALRD
jgi:hypothetical protein